MTRELVYFADPMCSWCYGFRSVVLGHRAAFRGRLPLRLVMGGLCRPHRPMRDKDKELHPRSLDQVKAASGQPFDFLLEREGLPTSSPPAARWSPCDACGSRRAPASWSGSNPRFMRRIVT